MRGLTQRANEAFARSVVERTLGRGIVRVTSVIRVRELSGRRRNAGFTLIEILVSFAVLSVATLILVKTFSGSLVLGSAVRHHRVAADVATEVLSEMQRNPASFTWPAVSDQLQPVTKTEGGAIEQPAVMPTYPRGSDQVGALYSGYKWRGYVRAVKPDSPLVELTAVVYWTDRGKTSHWTLTTLVPRRVIEAKS